MTNKKLREGGITSVNVTIENDLTTYVANIGNPHIGIRVELNNFRNEKLSEVTYSLVYSEDTVILICRFHTDLEPIDFFYNLKIVENETHTIVDFYGNITGVNKYMDEKRVHIMHHISNNTHVMYADKHHEDTVIKMDEINRVNRPRVEKENFMPQKYFGKLLHPENGHPENYNENLTYRCKCGARVGKGLYDLSKTTGYICPMCMTPVEHTEVSEIKELIKKQNISLKELKDSIINIGTKPE